MSERMSVSFVASMEFDGAAGAADLWGEACTGFCDAP
jgi:hypothetical protein